MGEVIEIPCIINGEEVFTVAPPPHKDTSTIVTYWQMSTPKEEMEAACEAAVNAQQAWIDLGLEGRCAIFERCADLLAGDWRMRVNAATMLNQSKTAFPAEIDSACELIDFGGSIVTMPEDSMMTSTAGFSGRCSEFNRDSTFGRICPFDYSIQLYQYRSKSTKRSSNRWLYGSLEAKP